MKEKTVFAGMSNYFAGMSKMVYHSFFKCVLDTIWSEIFNRRSSTKTKKRTLSQYERNLLF